MATIEMKVPSPGESITEVVIARWLKKDGEYVEKDEEVAEVDSDKATLTINAEESDNSTIKATIGSHRTLVSRFSRVCPVAIRT